MNKIGNYGVANAAPYNNEELLHEAIENGILDMAYIQKSVEMAKRQKYLKCHSGKIWKGNDGKWCTYLPDPIKGRRFVKKRTEEAVHDEIIKYYSQHDSTAKSFLQVYYEWRSYHDQMVDVNSVSKYNTDATRYFTDNKYDKENIKSYTKDSVSVFIKDRIDTLKLCKSATKRLFGYINCVFRYAEERGYIDKSPTTYLLPKDFYKYCYESERSKKDKILSVDNMRILQEQLQKDHEKTPWYIPSYAVEFASLTGMRVGEIAALRWDCIKDNCFIIDKSEKYNSENNTYYISKTKNGKDRIFPITEEIQELLDKVLAIEQEYGYVSEWIFSDKDGRLSFRKISSCMKNKCRQCHIDVRGIHIYRKTLNSQMEYNGVSATTRATLLGHSKEVNERYYTFDVTDIEEKRHIISMASRKSAS